MEANYTLGDLTPEEAVSITDELKAILEKYNCEMTVTSNIQILKRIPTEQAEFITSDGEHPSTK